MRAQALIAVDLVKFFGERRVLDGVTLTTNPGQRLGLVGENGAGKTTLLRLLAGTDTPDAGELTRPADTGLLHQELPYAAQQTVGEVIADALRESHQLLHRLDRLLHQPQRLDEYAEVLARPRFKFDPRRVREVLTKLEIDGLTIEASDQPDLKLPDPDDEPFLAVALAARRISS